MKKAKKGLGKKSTVAKAAPLNPNAPKKGAPVFYRNVGYGLTSYEEGDAVVRVTKTGQLFTGNFDSIPMEPTGTHGEWVFDCGLGLKTYATLHKPDGFKVEE